MSFVKQSKKAFSVRSKLSHLSRLKTFSLLKPLNLLKVSSLLGLFCFALLLPLSLMAQAYSVKAQPQKAQPEKNNVEKIHIEEKTIPYNLRSREFNNLSKNDEPLKWGLFRSNEVLAVNNPDWSPYAALWFDVLAREKKDPTFFNKTPKNLSLGETSLPKPYSDNWHYIISKAEQMDKKTKLRVVNALFNRQKRGDDKVIYKQDEYWASPTEFCVLGGDCEDFAIAKYFALRYLGFEANELRIVLVKMLKRKEHHAFLVARVDNINFVLDNNTRPADLILPDSVLVSEFLPLWSFNEKDAWQHWVGGQRGQQGQQKPENTSQNNDKIPNS